MKSEIISWRKRFFNWNDVFSQCTKEWWLLIVYGLLLVRTGDNWWYMTTSHQERVAPDRIWRNNIKYWWQLIVCDKQVAGTDKSQGSPAEAWSKQGSSCCFACVQVGALLKTSVNCSTLPSLNSLTCALMLPLNKLLIKTDQELIKSLISMNFCKLPFFVLCWKETSVKWTSRSCCFMRWAFIYTIIKNTGCNVRTITTDWVLEWFIITSKHF